MHFGTETCGLNKACRKIYTVGSYGACNLWKWEIWPLNKTASKFQINHGIHIHLPLVHRFRVYRIRPVIQVWIFRF